MQPRKTLARLRSGSRNVRFADAQSLATALGFVLERTRGSHHIYRHPRGAMLNLQPNRNRQAKPYQMRQLLQTINEHELELPK